MRYCNLTFNLGLSLNTIWWQCLVPTSITRLFSVVGYRTAKKMNKVIYDSWTDYTISPSLPPPLVFIQWTKRCHVQCNKKYSKIKLPLSCSRHWLVLHFAAIPNCIFLHDRRWISPWIKSISNALDITCHVFASQFSGHCDVIANRLWRHQQNVGRVSEHPEMMCEDPRS